MINGKFVSAKYIVDKLFQDNGYDFEPNWEDLLEWIWEAVNRIGAKEQYVKKFETLAVENYKVEIPCDVWKITMLRNADNHRPIKYASDVFHEFLACDDVETRACDPDLTYTINDYYIFLNREEANIELAWDAFPVDKDGYPLITDEDKVIEAVACYLRYKIDYKLWRTGKLPKDVYADSEVQWLFYVNSARNKLRLPSIDRMESIKKQYLRLIPAINKHENQFKSLNQHEQRNNRNTI